MVSKASFLSWEKGDGFLIWFRYLPQWRHVKNLIWRFFYGRILQHRPIIITQRQRNQNASVDWKNLEHICTWMLPTLDRANTFLYSTHLWQVCLCAMHNVQIYVYSDNKGGLRMITKTRAQRQVNRGREHLIIILLQHTACISREASWA